MMSANVTSNTESDANNNGTVSANNSGKSSRWHTTATALQNNIKVERHIPRFVFDPDSALVCYWTAAVAIATLYNAWMIALRIAFPEIREKSDPTYLTYVDLLSDFIYLMDIIVQLRTAYLQDGIPVFDPLKIRHQYISQTYFIRDLISILPSQTILSFLPDRLGYCKYFICTAGAARLTRLLKFHILYRFYDLAESLTSNPHLIRVLRLFLNLAVIIHWIACLYYLLSEFEGLGSNAWVYTNDTEQQRFTRKYIVCLYWSAMTLTTIGNTNSPETDIEYIFTGVIFLTGVFVFATVMGNVGDVISSMNANRQEFQARMDHIKMYLTHKKVPASLQLKIKKWAEYTWSRTKATDESRLLNMLPERLRAEVAVHVHLDSLKKVKIFEQCETGFLCELVLKLRSQVFSPGDYVCRAGETGREMFIINHGKVEVLVPSSATNKDMVVAVLSEGNYFGEISLLRLDGVQNRRTADVRSIGYAELLCLSRRDLMAALVEYPEAKYVLESQAKKRMRTNLQAQRAFSVDTLLRSSQDHSSMDSGIASKDEGRGHDVSEIKAMIEDLKNANKVPGRTVWQLIARCEVLQAKLVEKEKEIQDSKQRVKDLEELLVARHVPSQQLPSQNGDNVCSDKHLLRPNTKVTKQYSQDEGRRVLDNVVEEQELPKQNEHLIVPEVKVTSPSSSENGSIDEKTTPSQSKFDFQEDNFIKTSKISHVEYESSDGLNSGDPIRFIDDDIQEKYTYSNLPFSNRALDHSTLKGNEFKTEDSANSLKIVSENVLKMQPSSDGSYFNETSYHQKIVLRNFDRVSFTTSYKEEFTLGESFDVQTILEEVEEEEEDAEEEVVVCKTEDASSTSGNALPTVSMTTDSQYKDGELKPPDLHDKENAITPTSTNATCASHSAANTILPSSKYYTSNPRYLTESVKSPTIAAPVSPSESNEFSPLTNATSYSNCKCKPFSTTSIDSSSDSCREAGSLMPSNGGDPELPVRQSSERKTLRRSESRDTFISSGILQDNPDIPVLNRLCSSLERMIDPLDELDDGISFLRMGSLGSCFSEDDASRRNSWNFDSEYDTEEDTLSND